MVGVLSRAAMHRRPCLRFFFFLGCVGGKKRSDRVGTGLRCTLHLHLRLRLLLLVLLPSPLSEKGHRRSTPRCGGSAIPPGGGTPQKGHEERRKKNPSPSPRHVHRPHRRGGGGGGGGEEGGRRVACLLLWLPSPSVPVRCHMQVKGLYQWVHQWSRLLSFPLRRLALPHTSRPFLLGFVCSPRLHTPREAFGKYFLPMPLSLLFFGIATTAPTAADRFSTVRWTSRTTRMAWARGRGGEPLHWWCLGRTRRNRCPTRRRRRRDGRGSTRKRVWT